VPTLTCGLLRLNFSFAIAVSKNCVVAWLLDGGPYLVLALIVSATAFGTGS
jgi:hypothetical protein